MCKETSKALRRRWIEDHNGEFPWKALFSGRGIDIGSGDDPLPFEGCEPFDQQHGDANEMLKYFKPGTFNYVHASHILEHVKDAKASIGQWIKLLKKGGHLIGEVPSWELYEHRRPISIWNPDHKSTWSMWSKKGGGALPHYHAPTFFADVAKAFGASIVQVRLVDTNYNYQLGGQVDQTFHEDEGVECFIEFVLKKT